MAYTNSSLNPIAMYCISTSFRHYFHRLFCCCRPNNLNKDGSLSRGRPQGINSEIRGEPAGAKLPGTEPVPAFRGRIHSVPVLGRGKKPLLKSSSNTGCLRPHHSETRVSSSHLKEDPLPSPPVWKNLLFSSYSWCIHVSFIYTSNYFSIKGFWSRRQKSISGLFHCFYFRVMFSSMDSISIPQDFNFITIFSIVFLLQSGII